MQSAVSMTHSWTHGLPLNPPRVQSFSPTGQTFGSWGLPPLDDARSSPLCPTGELPDEPHPAKRSDAIAHTDKATNVRFMKDLSFQHHV
jgi:hypothetical protein